MSVARINDFGHLGPPPEHNNHCDVIIIDGVPQKVTRVVVHKIQVSDVEDPDLYISESLLQWEKSEVGQWVMNHAIESPTWHRYRDFSTFSQTYAIVAKLKEQDLVYWTLKYRG